jgi:NADH-quinone oxidoreductase subunit L
MAAGTLIAFLYYVLVPSLPALTARVFYPIYVFLLNKWYFDELYDFLFVRPTFWLANVLWKVGDIGIINGLIDGTAAGVYRVTARAVRLQTGYIYHYAFTMLIGLALLVTYFMFMGGGR